MQSIDTGLRNAIASGESEYPLIVCSNTDGDTHIFTASEIWNGSLEIDRYTSNGSFIEVGTAIAAECKAAFRYDQSFLAYFAESWDMSVFVGCRSYWNYDEKDNVYAARLPGQVNSIATSLARGKSAEIIYVGKDADLSSAIDGITRVNFGFVYTIERGSDGTFSASESRPLVRMGVFYPDSVNASKTNIRVTALDCMTLLDKPADLIGLDYVRLPPNNWQGHGYWPTNPYATDPSTGYMFVDETYDYRTAIARQDMIVPFRDIAERITNRTGVFIQTTFPFTQDGGTAYPKRQPYYYGGVGRFSEYTWRQLLQYISQMTGGWYYAPADRRETVFYGPIKGSAESITVNSASRYSYELKTLAPINIKYVVVSFNGKDYTSVNPRTETGITYRISNNPFLKEVPRESLFQSYANELLGIFESYGLKTYQPFKASILQRPDLELIDKAEIELLDGETTYAPITHINYRLNEPMMIECAGTNDSTVSAGSSPSSVSNAAVKSTLNNTTASNIVNSSINTLYENSSSGAAQSSTFKVSGNIRNYNLFFVTLRKTGSTPESHRILCSKDLSGDDLSAISGSLVTTVDSYRQTYVVRLSFAVDDSSSTYETSYRVYVNRAEASPNSADCVITKLEGFI